MLGMLKSSTSATGEYFNYQLHAKQQAWGIIGRVEKRPTLLEVPKLLEVRNCVNVRHCSLLLFCIVAARHQCVEPLIRIVE